MLEYWSAWSLEMGGRGRLGQPVTPVTEWLEVARRREESTEECQQLGYLDEAFKTRVGRCTHRWRRTSTEKEAFLLKGRTLVQLGEQVVVDTNVFSIPVWNWNRPIALSLNAWAVFKWTKKSNSELEIKRLELTGGSYSDFWRQRFWRHSSVEIDSSVKKYAHRILLHKVGLPHAKIYITYIKVYKVVQKGLPCEK